MPRHRMESLVRTIILNRCRRQRLGLWVESVETFAEMIAQLDRRVLNAEKQPAPATNQDGLLIFLDANRVTAQLERATLSVRRWAGRLDVDRSAGWYLGTFAGHALTVARDPDLDSVRRGDLVLDVVPEPVGDRRLSQHRDTDDLGIDDVEHAQTAGHDPHRTDHGERDPERLARAGHRHMWRAHRASA